MYVHQSKNTDWSKKWRFFSSSLCSRIPEKPGELGITAEYVHWTLVIVNAWIVNNLSLVNIFGETGRLFYNINYMLNSKHLSLVNKIGDKTNFTITRVHCTNNDFFLLTEAFSLFSVVTFPNDECTTVMDPTMRGLCITAEECTDQGGTASGNCASGFGVCCFTT